MALIPKKTKNSAEEETVHFIIIVFCFQIVIENYVSILKGRKNAFPSTLLSLG